MKLFSDGEGDSNQREDMPHCVI